jgi:SAM-dependent methyltransferase
MSQPTRPRPPFPDVGELVRNFYDRYPYPRPVDSLENYRRFWEDPQRRRADYHLLRPDRPYREDGSILVAGCGTSQAAKHALRWPRAQVIGVDISETSMRWTAELKRKYNLTNLEIHQLPIDQVSKLERRFDQIVCTGVLHHLEDPDAGLAALRAVLERDGAMHLMVYAPYGRAGVYMLQEFCRRVGIRATDEGIKNLVAALNALPAGHPLESLLRQAPDFQSEAELADALLHPQDRAYSVPQLFEFIEKAGLKFGRWIRQAPYSRHCGVMANIPQTLRIAELPEAGQYAAAELFRGTMVRHSVVVYRDDRFGDMPPIRFEGDECWGYVPIRLPDTICVQERLPDGAAGVLINRTHTYSDLFMPVDSVQKRLFDAIDGRRTLRAIADAVIHSSRDQSQSQDVRAFFELLWWHDMVVFDTSGQ